MSLFASPENERILAYSPHSPERTALSAALDHHLAAVKDIPVIAGGKRIASSETEGRRHGVAQHVLLVEFLEAAGLPPGVINFVPGDARTISVTVLASPDFAARISPGSTAVFDTLWRACAERSCSRLVGETGGRDFVLAHESADPRALAIAFLRGVFEYRGRKCGLGSSENLRLCRW